MLLDKNIIIDFSKKNLTLGFLVISFFYFSSNYFYFYVNPLVNYMWKLDIIHSYNHLFINYIFIIFIFFSIPRNELFEYHFFLIILIGIFIPITIISNHTSIGLFACFVYFFCISLSIYIYKLIKLFFDKSITINVSGRRILTKNRFLYFNKIITVFILLYLISNNWTKFTSFNLFETLVNVYSIRDENKLTGIDAYFPGWLISIFVPFLFVSYFRSKDFLSLLIAVVGIFFMFQIFAMKVQLFSILLIFFFGFVFVNFSRLRIFSVEIFFLFIFLVTIMSGNFMYAFLDRFFYLPGQLNIHYFEFFLTHSYNYFNGSKLGIFFNTAIYNRPMGFVIDDFFYGGGMNANTGYLASSFGDLGFIGLLFASVIISIICFFFSILSHKSKLFAYIISVQFAFTLINAPLTDLFISNGLIYLFIIILVLKSKNLSTT